MCHTVHHQPVQGAILHCFALVRQQNKEHTIRCFVVSASTSKTFLVEYLMAADINTTHRCLKAENELSKLCLLASCPQVAVALNNVTREPQVTSAALNCVHLLKYIYYNREHFSGERERGGFQGKGSRFFF